MASWLGGGGARGPGRVCSPKCPLKLAPPGQAPGLSDWPSGPGAACGPDVLLSPEIGLCVSMRSLPWYVQANPDTFFPRCYSLCTEGEKQEFLGEWGPEAQGLSAAWPPARRTGLRAGGGGLVLSQPALGAVSGLGTKAASWLDLSRGTGERRTGRGRWGRQGRAGRGSRGGAHVS